MLETRRRPGRAARGLMAVASAAIVVASGCAYYNTFYNAKKTFKKAEEERVQSNGTRGDDSYQHCIDKCQLLLRYYPKSKYVDDALYLIGVSRFYRGEYVQARASLEELVDRFPKSEYAERAYYQTGLAAIRQGDAAGAAEAFGKLATHFPDSKLNVEAVFRSAEARLDSHDYEKAREELRAFMAEHPKSDLVPGAQLRLARTYYDEHRYREARIEYDRVLKLDVHPDVQYEARLRAALAQRALAEEVLSNPRLQRASRMRRGAKDLERFEAAIAEVSAQTQREAKPQTRNPGAPSGYPGEPQEGATGPGGRPVEAGTEPGGAEFEPDSDQVAPPGGAAERDRQRATSHGGDTPSPPGVAAVDSGGTAPGEAEGAATSDTLAVTELSAQEKDQLEAAEHEFDEVASRLAALRKPAAKLGRQVELGIEMAVTRALRGEPGDAISDLDQIARSQPATEPAAVARYETGEIYRRLGEFDKARRGYEESLRARPDSKVADSARRKSTAITARSQGTEALRNAPKTLARWNAVREKERAAGTAAPLDTTMTAAGDSLGERLALEAAFQELAQQQLRVAEIDLFDLDQPLVALREFQEVLERYPESLQCPRAAFGIAWIYHHELNDPERARQAYEAVVRDHGDTPQGREARSILDRWTQTSGVPEAKKPSSRL